MQAIEIGCSKCGSEDFRLLDQKTGEVICQHCRNRWIEPALIKKTETEKLIEEQAKRPRVVIDNTTETDKQLMDMISKVAGAATGGCARKASRVVVAVVVVVIILFVLSFFGVGMLFGR